MSIENRFLQHEMLLNPYPSADAHKYQRLLGGLRELSLLLISGLLISIIVGCSDTPEPNSTAPNYGTITITEANPTNGTGTFNGKIALEPVVGLTDTEITILGTVGDIVGSLYVSFDPTTGVAKNLRFDWDQNGTLFKNTASCALSSCTGITIDTTNRKISLKNVVITGTSSVDPALVTTVTMNGDVSIPEETTAPSSSITTLNGPAEIGSTFVSDTGNVVTGNNTTTITWTEKTNLFYSDNIANRIKETLSVSVDGSGFPAIFSYSVYVTPVSDTTDSTTAKYNFLVSCSGGACADISVNTSTRKAKFTNFRFLYNSATSTYIVVNGTISY